MDDKISLGTLAALMAQASGKSKKLCEDFLREFFKLTVEALADGEALKIKGFGTFKISEVEGRTGVNVATGQPQEIAPYKKVVFTPAKELASAINAPFEEFESVEMDDEIPEDIFFEDEETDEAEEEKNIEPEKEEPISEPVPEEEQPTIEPEPQEELANIEPEPEEELPNLQEVAEEEKLGDENEIETGILEAGSDEEGDDDDITAEAYYTLEQEEKTQESEPVSQENQPEQINVVTQPQEPVVPDYYEYPEQKSRFGMGFLWGAVSMFAVCAVVFMLGCFFNWWPVNFESPWKFAKDAEVEMAAADPVEPVEEVAPEPEPEPVYDTVSKTRYLTTMAREYYGDFNFWPYIYLENDSILGHPDRITPGTQVVVPDLKKYGVSPENPEDVAKAKEIAKEIYARYK